MKKRLCAALLAALMCAGILPMLVSAADETKTDTWDGTADTGWYNETETEFHLKTAEQLAGLAQLVNARGNGNTFEGKTIYLENDLDLSGHIWESIGTGSNHANYFAGTFDGQYHVIHRLTNTQVHINHALFGTVVRGTVRNLGIADAHIAATENSSTIRMGLLAEWALNATFKNCFTTGSLTGSTNSGAFLGGLIGEAMAGTQIIGCYSSAVIESKAIEYPEAVGGLVGAWETPGNAPMIADSYFDGKILFSGGGTAQTGMSTNVGGILGMCFDNVTNLLIQNCMVATETVQAPSDIDIEKGNGGMWLAWYYLGVPENCYWPVDDREWPASIEFTKLIETGDPEQFLHFDCGTPTSDFKADSVLQGLKAKAQADVTWVAGFEHPTFAWDLRNIPADYTAVDTAKGKVPADLSQYTPNTAEALKQALELVASGKSKAEQNAVDAMAKAIEDAVGALQFKPADYSRVDAAIAEAQALNKDAYTDFSAVDAAVRAVVRGKNITEQNAVDAMAKAIEDAVGALEKKPADIPQTGDPGSTSFWFILLLVSAVAAGGILTTVNGRRAKQ